MKIVADRNIPAIAAYFGSMGSVELVEGRGLDAEAVADAKLLLVRSVTRVDSALLAGSAVRFVGSATSGQDHIDPDFLQRQGIGFAHAPGCNAQSVVEYVLAAICAVDGSLEKLLRGGTLGVVGYGHVGRALVALCGQLGIACRVFDPWLEDVPATGTFEDILRCDVISLHCELTKREPWPSRHLLDHAALEHVRPGSLLINASRGSVIDNAALLTRLRHRPDIGVVLDVWEGEPSLSADLLSLVNIGTPHIAGYSLDGKVAATHLLHEAAAEFFSIDAPAVIAAVEPAPAITLADDSDLAAAIKRLVKSRYNILEDDARLRAATVGIGRELAAQGFDRLRREYPERREVSRSSVHYCGKDALVLSAIAAFDCALNSDTSE